MYAGTSNPASSSHVGAKSTLVPRCGSSTPAGTPGPRITIGMRSEWSYSKNLFDGSRWPPRLYPWSLDTNQ